MERYLQVLETPSPALEPLIAAVRALNAVLNEHFRLKPHVPL
jgi:hypothetical protein